MTVRGGWRNIASASGAVTAFLGGYNDTSQISGSRITGMGTESGQSVAIGGFFQSLNSGGAHDHMLIGNNYFQGGPWVSLWDANDFFS